MNPQRLFISFFLFLSLVSGCDSTSPHEYVDQASEKYFEGKTDEAFALLDKALQKNPDFVPAYLKRGTIKMVMKDYEGSIIDFNTALKLKPNSAKANWGLANNYEFLKDHSKAVEYYNKTIILNLDKKKNRNKNENNLLDYDWVDEMDPYFNRGISYFYLDSLLNAEMDIQFALNMNYREVECYMWLSNIELIKGNDERSNYYLEKALGFQFNK